MNELLKFSYEGNDITFERGDSVMANATEMSRAFGKKPIDWLKTRQSEQYITALTKVKNITLADLVTVNRGGDNPGTWFHEDVAMEYARWLNPEFAIWCNDRVKELGKYGFTATDLTIDKMVSDPDFAISLLTRLKEQRVINERSQKQIERLSPKAELADRIIDMDQLVDIGQAAKLLQLDFGRNRLFKRLRESGVFFLNKNEPKQAYIERGYFKLKERIIENEHGSFPVIKVLVTQKGLQWLAEKFEAKPEVKLSIIK